MNYPKIFCDIAENQNLKFSENLLDQNYEETWLYSTICKTGELE